MVNEKLLALEGKFRHQALFPGINVPCHPLASFPGSPPAQLFVVIVRGESLGTRLAVQLSEQLQQLPTYVNKCHWTSNTVCGHGH